MNESFENSSIPKLSAAGVYQMKDISYIPYFFSLLDRDAALNRANIAQE